jgi:hypothetical protein
LHGRPESLDDLFALLRIARHGYQLYIPWASGGDARKNQCDPQKRSAN